jgi:dipeptidyl aminopeptidase/acylaminoacyl peptidase
MPIAVNRASLPVRGTRCKVCGIRAVPRLHRPRHDVFRSLTLFAALAFPLAAASPTSAQQAGAGASSVEVRPLDRFERQIVRKMLNDSVLFAEVGGAARASKTVYPGADGFPVPAYVFSPHDTTVPRPLIILVHGGIHSDFAAHYAPEVLALVRLGYVIIAPEYRGSTGYGRVHYEAIDYGGKEVEDCIAAIDFAASHVPWADTSRVAMFGWSHGGFIALHALFRRPERFRAAVAHVPVADLPTRMRTHDDAYHELYVRQPGFGDRLENNPEPYIQRSPIAHARKLRRPVLVHTASNDDDVYIIENRNLRDSMQVAGMIDNGLFSYREWTNPPGGHAFSRMDTPQGRESWAATVAFLARHLAHR